jgi:hypothetical protein
VEELKLNTNHNLPHNSLNERRTEELLPAPLPHTYGEGGDEEKRIIRNNIFIVYFNEIEHQEYL